MKYIFLKSQKVLELFAGDETQAKDFLAPAVAQKS